MDYLVRVLTALREQTLSLDQWELLVIDNHSAATLKDQIDLRWHPDGRCIREDELGLTPARLRGIAEAQADLIVFVDDDNVIASDYLGETLKIAQEHPSLGVWGGRIIHEFELSAKELAGEFARSFVAACDASELKRDMWAFCWPPAFHTVPTGAGMTVRRVVADCYAKDVHGDPLRRKLDRKGTDVTACGDTDLAITTWKCELGTGLFVRLSLTHLMPAHRVQPGYQQRVTEDLNYSMTLLRYIHHLELPSDNIFHRVYHALRGMRRRGFDRIAYFAVQRGIRRALREIQCLCDGESS
jgi:glycosyltransferase involved in cell wall biosynthesis